jgi:protein-tyrosine kinase
VSGDQFAQPAQSVDDEILDSLVGRYGLSEEVATQIRTLMQTEQARWGEAAMLNGLLTSSQLEDAMTRLGRQDSGSNDGIIQKALRRSTGRAIVKVEGTEVKPGPKLIFAHDPYDPRSEKIRALRTELLLLNDTSAMILALVGSGPAEGRSVLAAELALAFAQLGRRTLLVDADMRKPSQHLLFETNNTLGLAQCIDGRGQAYMHRVSGLPAMSLLTAGIATSNPLELLSSQRFHTLADSWRNQFEFIIIDTPPVSQFADGLTVATLAGRVLVVSRSVETTFRDLKELLRRLTVTRSQILGAVINHF